MNPRRRLAALAGLAASIAVAAGVFASGAIAAPAHAKASAPPEVCVALGNQTGWDAYCLTL